MLWHMGPIGFDCADVIIDLPGVLSQTLKTGITK